MLLTNEITTIIDNIKVNKQKGIYAVYKPLLLLLILNDIKNGQANSFKYSEMDARLTALMEKYGWQTKNKKQSEYPFMFLASSVIWEINIDQTTLKHPKSPTHKEMENAIGKLNQKIFDFLRDNPKEADKIKSFIELKFFGRNGISI
jgi:predicted restriction endonuclease